MNTGGPDETKSTDDAGFENTAANAKGMVQTGAEHKEVMLVTFVRSATLVGPTKISATEGACPDNMTGRELRRATLWKIRRGAA